MALLQFVASAKSLFLDYANTRISYWNEQTEESQHEESTIYFTKALSIYIVNEKKPFSRSFTMCNLSRHALETKTNLHVMPPFSTLYK